MRPEFPNTILTAEIINRIRSDQEDYDSNPERAEREQRERKEREEMEQEQLYYEEQQQDSGEI